MKYLITGNGGSGKTAICEELASRGFEAVDADKNGLAQWQDAFTGQPVEVDHTQFVDYSKVAWNWNRTKLKELLENKEDIFVCGSASNQFDFYSLFDSVFVLNPSPEVQRHRLMTRASDYGKDEKTREWIIADQKEVVEMSVRLGAIAIEADGSVAEVTDQILAKAHINEG